MAAKANYHLQLQMRVFSARLFFITGLLICFSLFSYAQFEVKELKTDYQSTPLGMDVTKPVFSWQMSAAPHLRSQIQTGYQISVTDEGGRLVWDSKKISSNASIGIRYNGLALNPATRYTWKLKVWNQNGKLAMANSWFETGLMNADPKLSAWSGANWIGGGDEDLVFYAHYFTVFKFNYGIQLDQSSGAVKAAFVFGANDSRLMDPNMNANGLSSAKNALYVKLELDISNLNGSESGKAKLNIYRVGYSKDDRQDKPFRIIDIPLSLINQDNKYNKHQIFASSIFGVFDFWLDAVDSKHRIPVDGNGNASSININPIGWGGDYTAYPIVGDIGFALDKGQKAYFSNVTVSNNRFPSNVLFSENLNDNPYHGIFAKALGQQFQISNGSYAIDALQRSVQVLADPTRNSSPMLRTEFSTSTKTITKARIYATARGIYELYLNGKRVGEDYFNPGLTQYNKTHLYQTYDVTKSIIQGGANALGALLSEGWWSGNITYSGNHWNFFGDRQSLLAKLVITYQDGTEQLVITDPGKWKYYNDGPISYGSFFQGEVYDATKEASIEGWNKAGFRDTNWEKAKVVELQGTAFAAANSGTQQEQVGLDFSNLQLVGMPGVTAKVVKEIKPIAVQEVRPGVFVYDMGQNMVGFPEVKLNDVAKGDQITFRYAEIKYPDLPQYSSNKGMVMLENMRAAMVRDIYYCKGAGDVMQPRFTFHGFRYIEITGLKKVLPLTQITVKVLSSIDHITAGYETSNPLVNRLWQNIIWSMMGNFLLIPTDTPARNERMGWSGDISVFSKTATYLSDVNVFLKRHMLAMRDLQYLNGRFTDTAPVTDAFGGVLWGSAGIVVAWEAYQQYGDEALLLEHYGAMKRYLAFLKTRIDPKTGMIDEGPLGDWLSPENYKSDDTILWDAYYAYDLEIMAQVAHILHMNDDSADFRKQYLVRKKHFNDTHIDAETGKTLHSGHRFSWGYRIASEKLPQPGGFSDTQASYAVPLAFGIIDQKYIAKASRNLADAVARENMDEDSKVRPAYSLMTGFIGTAAVSKALSNNGYPAEAYRLLQQTSYPSWLYSVKNGATTIWERLNSYTKEDGFGTNNSMNSFNHYSFGAVGAWMINQSLGIERGAAGFKNIVLEPIIDPTGEMTYAKGSYDSMYGKVVSEWKVASNFTTYRFQIPANASATLLLPASSLNKVTEGGLKIGNHKGLSYKGSRNGKLVFELGSGTYNFLVRK
ncbi:family 78 glycoside hydrolase catalytic domain [Pedobacter sp. PWIIR3]